MKIMVSAVFRNSQFVMNSTKLSRIKNIPCRSLFNQESLKIQSFMANRTNNAEAINNIIDFKNSMKKKSESNINHLIFVNDLKKMIAVTETDNDLLLLMDLVKKYESNAEFHLQSNVIRFTSFNIGPEIIRLHYVLNKPKEAYKLIKDPDVSACFFDVSSLTILGDMLFRNEMFEEVICMVHLVLNKQLRGKKFPHNLIILHYASCYKLNTPQSLGEAIGIWEEMLDFNFKCPLRGIWFLSCLAIKQKQPDFALKVLLHAKSNPIGNNIRVLAHADKEEWDEVLTLMSAILMNDTPSKTTADFMTSDCLSYIERALGGKSRSEILKKFLRLKEELIAHNFVVQKSLEEYLLEEIKIRNYPEHFKGRP